MSLKDIAYYAAQNRIHAKPDTWAYWHEQRHAEQDAKGYMLAHDMLYPVLMGATLGMLWFDPAHAAAPALLHFSIYVYMELDAHYHALKTHLKKRR